MRRFHCRPSSELGLKLYSQCRGGNIFLVFIKRVYPLFREPSIKSSTVNTYQCDGVKQVPADYVPHSHTALAKQPHHTGYGGLQLEHRRLVHAKLVDAAACVDVPVNDKTFTAGRDAT